MTLVAVNYLLILYAYIAETKMQDKFVYRELIEYSQFEQHYGNANRG